MSSTPGTQPLFRRIWNTAVFWTWLFNGLRVASGLLLMPLLWRYLGEAELSIYSQFVFLTGFLYTFDAMFSTTIARNVGYAIRGVSDIQAEGIAAEREVSGKPNITLLGQLFSVTRVLYRYLSLGILVVLGVGGTLVMIPFIANSANPALAWQAWVITIVGACLELYTGYWLVFLRGMNLMVFSARLSTLVYALKLGISIILLFANFGLLAVPISALVTGLVQRLMAWKFTRRHLPAGFHEDSSRDKDLMTRLWPNSWRLGLVLASLNLMFVGFGTICSHVLKDASLFYRYQFSQNIIYSVCMGMATVWTAVKWPIVAQLRAADDYAAMRRLLWPRIWLQNVSFILMTLGVILFAPPLFEWIEPTKELLPTFWLCLMALHTFLEMQYIFWTALLSTENRIPSLWAAVITSLAALVIAYVLARFTELGLGAFVLAPLLAGLAFNYWYWPSAGARSIGTSWLRYLCRRPA